MAAITLPTTTKAGAGANKVGGVAASGLAQGQVVYRTATRTLALARANSTNTDEVVGIAEQTATTGAPITAIVDGVLTGLSGLAVGVVYCLAPGTAGAIIADSELTTGDWVVVIGVALTATTLKLGIINTGIQKA